MKKRAKTPRRRRLSDSERYRMMSSFRKTGSASTEKALALAFRRARVTGWRRHVALPGRPDFVFRTSRVVVFADGCFWHGCPHHCRMPSRNQSYWQGKVKRNRARDRAVAKLLLVSGWRVVRVWEHELASNIDRFAMRISILINANGRGRRSALRRPSLEKQR